MMIDICKQGRIAGKRWRVKLWSSSGQGSRCAASMGSANSIKIQEEETKWILLIVGVRRIDVEGGSQAWQRAV